MIDTDDSSQSDIAARRRSRAARARRHTRLGTKSETHCGLRKCPHFPPLVSPNSPELLIIWAAFQRTSDYTFSKAPQAQRWRTRKEEV